MSDKSLPKQYRELRRQLRRATDAAQRQQLQSALHAVVQRMTPKQRESLGAPAP